MAGSVVGLLVVLSLVMCLCMVGVLIVYIITFILHGIILLGNVLLSCLRRGGYCA